MSCSSGESTLLSIFLSVASELERFLLPATWMLRFGVEIKSIAIVYISSSSKMEHISATDRVGESNTGAIPIHHICVGDDDDVGRGNGADNSDDAIFLSSFLS